MDLIHKLVDLAERFTGSAEDATVIHNQAQEVRDAVKVRIQSVADYLYMELDQEKFHIERDFPNLTPLWPVACYTWAIPPFIRSEGQILPNPSGVEYVCLAAAKPYDKPPVKWACNFLYWAWHPDFPNMIRQIFMVIAINADGRVCDLEPGAPAGGFRYASGSTNHWPTEPPQPSTPEIARGLHTLLYPVLLAISRCNQHTARIEREPTPLPGESWYNIVIERERGEHGLAAVRGSSEPVIAVEAGETEQSRKKAFDLLGIQLKTHGIHRKANFTYEVVIPFGGSNELTLSARSRKQLHQAIDQTMALLTKPETAKDLYRYFGSLAQRAKKTGFEVVGDLITPDGIFNADGISATKH